MRYQLSLKTNSIGVGSCQCREIGFQLDVKPEMEKPRATSLLRVLGMEKVRV